MGGRSPQASRVRRRARAAGLAIPFLLGFLVKGTLTGAFLTLAWGGLVRVFFLHHATFSINSICHFFGRRRFPTPDRSTNVAWLSVHTLPGAKVSFGELECTAEVGLNL